MLVGLWVYFSSSGTPPEHFIRQQGVNQSGASANVQYATYASIMVSIQPEEVVDAGGNGGTQVMAGTLPPLEPHHCPHDGPAKSHCWWLMFEGEECVVVEER